MQCTYGAQITFDKKMWKTSFKALGLPQGVWKTILGDIFGAQVGTHFEGLVDSANAAAFNANLASLEMNWNNLETGAIQHLNQSFNSWFTEYKGPKVVGLLEFSQRCERKLKYLDIHCNFTQPTEVNQLITWLNIAEVQWKENKLSGLIKHLKVICDRQVAETQKAIIHHEEWRFE